MCFPNVIFPNSRVSTYCFKIFGSAEEQGRSLPSPNPVKEEAKILRPLAGRSVTHLIQGNKWKVKYVLAFCAKNHCYETFQETSE